MGFLDAPGRVAPSGAGLLPFWKASTIYVAGQRVVAPNGDVVAAKVNFTTGATYNAADWNASTQDGRIATLETDKWAKTAILTGTDNLDTIGSGFFKVLNGTNASALGLPSANPGSVESMVLGTQAVQRYSPSTGADAGKMWMRVKTTGGWQPWVRKDATNPDADKWYYGTAPIADGTNLDTLANGVHTVWNGAIATSIGLPSADFGVVESTQFGTAGTQRFTTATGASSTAKLWARSKSSGIWSAWARVDVGAAQAQATASAAPASGFKTVPLALTLGTGSGDAALTGSVRLPMNFAAPITRWRVCIRNTNPRYGFPRPGAVTFTGLWYGPHAGAGAYSAAPTQIQPAFTTDAAGSLWTSNWFAGKPLGGGTDYLLSFGYTAGLAVFELAGGCWKSESPADASLAGPAVTLSKTAPFDIWVEAETYATTPVVGAFGDSLSCGVSATLPVHDSPISQYARGKGALPMHFAASGDSMDGWADSGHYKWTRWAGLAKPDAVIFAMGSNDIFLGATLSTMQARHAVAAAQLKAILTPNVYAATIMPRTSVTGAMETVRRDYNTWLRTLPNAVRDLFEFASSISADDETITPAFDADGIHLTTAGYAQNAAAIVRPITTPPVVYQTV